jgi:ABC-type uncharacterized transport system ATPase subunit
MEEVAALCDRVLVLNRGETAMIGSVDLVYSQGEKLAELGLELPEIAKIFALMKTPATVYTPEEAYELLTKGARTQ